MSVAWRSACWSWADSPIVAVQRAAPLLEPPLYDGVVVAEPYRWLVPPPGAVGDPTSASATASLEGGKNPLIAVATAESPPQAQIFASRAALVIPDGTTGLVMSIQPVLPQSLPTDGHIAGNVYRILVTNQAGVPLTAPASARVTIVLRGPETEPQVTMAQFGPDGWVPLETTDAGFGSTHLAVVTSFGDFTLIAPGPGGPYPTAAGSASSSPAASGGANPGSGGPSSSPPSETASSVPAEPSSPSGGGSASGGPPIALLAAIVAILLLGIIGLSGLRRRTQRRRPYRGARPRRR